VPAGTAVHASFLPYLGNESEIAGGREGDRLVFVLPDVQKGAVLRIDDR